MTNDGQISTGYVTPNCM